MYVSAEVLTIVVSAIGVAATVLGGMLSGARFLLSRMDQRFAASEKRIDERFARVDEQFAAAEKRIDDQFAAAEKRTDERFAAAEKRTDERFAALEERFDERFARVDEQLANLQGQIVDLRSEVHTVAEDVVDLRIAVARVEGPKPQLLPAR